MNKRITAYIIDYFLIAVLLVLCGISNLPDWVWWISFNIGEVPVTLPSFGFPFLITPFVLKDCVYGNASIGQKSMGLVIVDEKWGRPSFKVMMKRGFLLLSIGIPTYILSKTNGMDFEVWEYEKTKTRVIEKELYEKMKRVCEEKPGDYKQNMDDYYNNHILEKYN